MLPANATKPLSNSKLRVNGMCNFSSANCQKLSGNACDEWAFASRLDRRFLKVPNGGLAHLSPQRTEAAPSFAVFEGWAAEARRRTLPGLLPSTARGVAHSLKLPRVRRKHNTENCSMPTAPARAPVRA